MSDLAALSIRFLEACGRRGIFVATAESCTGGGIIATMTDMPGSSAMVDRGFVTYSNEAKMDMLGVRPETLASFGAVSAQTAIEMAQGALDRSRAGIALSVTGIAGPGGGSAGKPVGLVWFGVAVRGKPAHAEMRIFDDRGRDFIRKRTIATAFELGLAALGERQPAD